VALIEREKEKQRLDKLQQAKKGGHRLSIGEVLFVGLLSLAIRTLKFEEKRGTSSWAGRI